MELQSNAVTIFHSPHYICYALPLSQYHINYIILIYLVERDVDQRLGVMVLCKNILVNFSEGVVMRRH